VVGEVETLNHYGHEGSRRKMGARSHFYALFAEEDDQAAGRESGSDVVASGNVVGEEQDCIIFEGASVTEHIVFADVVFDLAVEQWAERDIQGFDGREHAARLRVDHRDRSYKLERAS